MREDHRHTARFVVQTAEHMEDKGVIALGRGRDAPVKALVGVQRRGHFLFFLAVFVGGGVGEKAAVPFVQTERRIGDYRLKLH